MLAITLIGRRSGAVEERHVALGKRGRELMAEVSVAPETPYIVLTSRCHPSIFLVAKSFIFWASTKSALMASARSAAAMAFFQRFMSR